MLLSIIMAAVLQGPIHIKVSDFGARVNTRVDCTTAFSKAIEAARGKSATIDLEPGDYHFYREDGTERNLFLSNTVVANPRNIAILLENCHGLAIRGNGARLLFHDRVMPIAVLESHNITIDGLTIDWERPLMSQGKIVESGPTGFVLEVDSDKYPYTIKDSHLYFRGDTWQRRVWSFMEFDPSNRGVAPGTGDSGFTDGDWNEARVVELKLGLIRFEYPCRRFPKVGNILVARHGVRDHAGTFIEKSKDINLSNIAYRHTSGLGVLSQYSENLTFKHVDVAPDPASGRMFAGHDDGFHFSNCRGHIEVDTCRFEGLMDDPINVHGTSVRVLEKLSSNILKCRFMHAESVGLPFAGPNDTVSFIDHQSMISLGKGKVKSFKRLSDELFDLTFVGPCPPTFAAGDSLENLTWTPSFTVRNSVFGRVRARGLLVSTPKKVRVENCRFESSGAAILISGDANYWFESGAVTDVLIRGNTFENCNSSPYQFGDAVISIHPEIPRPGLAAFHRGIKIEKNIFKVFETPILWAKSVNGLTFKSNTIIQTQAFPALRSEQDGFTFIGCENVTIRDNKSDPKYHGRSVMTYGGKPDSFDVEAFRISIPK